MKVPVLVIATRNRHKVEEIRQVLGDGFRVFDLEEFPGAPPVVEDAPTFAGNARKKSESLARWLIEQTRIAGDFALADDSGLEVDALGGAPGVHSARFATLDQPGGGNAPDAANNAKLLRLLASTPAEKRTARFRCVLALTAVAPGFATEFFEGECPGRIAFEPSGGGGFGYDPLFIPEGFSESFAELGASVKNTMSHRARALQGLRTRLAEAKTA